MQVDCLTEVIQQARKGWDFVLGLVPSERMEDPDPHSGWTVKDQIAHIAWHDEQMIQLMEAKELVGSQWWGLTTDERNENIQKQYKDMPLEDVLEFAERSYKRMMAGLAKLDDDDLNDSRRFANLPAEWTPWSLIASNTYQHYTEHAIGIRRMLRNPAWQTLGE